MARMKVIADATGGKSVELTALETAERDRVDADWESKAEQRADDLVKFEKNQYQRDRQPNYPPMTDYLDGIVKGDQAQIDKYIADCLAVKEKYPKGGN